MSPFHDSLNSLSEMTDQVAVQTSVVGRETLKRDLRRISGDYQAVSTNAQELLEQLQTLLQKWTDFELSHGSFTSWLETAVQTVRNASEMSASLDAKVEQVNTVKVGFVWMLHFAIILHHLPYFSEVELHTALL